MRKEFSASIEKLMIENEKIVFMTGDLGYNALENLQNRFPNRFFNTGVAEQNMVGMAAGLASKGFKVFCYSIAPFVVYRCLEQFRNDVCLHDLPVFIVGNGGGYGYGIMGSSHHAIEDLACLSGLQNVKCWVPGFSDSVEPVLNQIVKLNKPAYLRLGVGGISPAYKNYGSIKYLNPKMAFNDTIIICLGPIVGNVLSIAENQHFSICIVEELPLEIPDVFFEEIESKNVIVVEEHISIGGLGQQLGILFLEKGVKLRSFKSLRAEGYPDGVYGSQKFHQEKSNLTPSQILAEILLLQA